MMNNQTMPSLPTEFLLSIGRFAAISSLLFIVILVLMIMFLLFFQQKDFNHFDEHELQSETDSTIKENKMLELSSSKQYASTDNNQLMIMTTSMNSFQLEIDEEKTRSITNLISSSK